MCLGWVIGGAWGPAVHLDGHLHTALSGSSTDLLVSSVIDLQGISLQMYHQQHSSFEIFVTWKVEHLIFLHFYFSIFYLFNFKHLSFVCVHTMCCVCVLHTHAREPMEVRGQLSGLILSDHVGSRDQTQVFGLGGKLLYPLSYFAILCFCLSNYLS